MAKVSKYGQWKYPGEDTIIPSGDITMKGVPYPVLGIDNLGNFQMMMPGANYQFPGNAVYEIPMMSAGGIVNPCPPGQVPDGNGNCVDDLTTPPIPSSSLYPYYTEQLAKLKADPSINNPEEIAGSVIRAKRKCTSDGCTEEWEEIEPVIPPKVKDPNIQKVLFNTDKGDIYKVQDRITKRLIRYEDFNGNPIDINNPNGTPANEFYDRGPNAQPNVMPGKEVRVSPGKFANGGSKKVKIKSLPKAQDFGELTPEQQKHYENRYIYNREHGFDPDQSNKDALLDAQYFNTGPVYNFQPFLPDPDSGVIVPSGKRYPLEYINWDTYKPFDEAMYDPSFSESYYKADPELQARMKDQVESDYTAENYYNSLENVKDWEKSWYTKRAQLPQFADIANKRLSLISDVNMQPITKSDFSLVVPNAGAAYMPDKNEVLIPTNSWRNPSTFVHERSHWFDWNAPQNDDMYNGSYFRSYLKPGNSVPTPVYNYEDETLNNTIPSEYKLPYGVVDPLRLGENDTNTYNSESEKIIANMPEASDNYVTAKSIKIPFKGESTIGDKNNLNYFYIPTEVRARLNEWRFKHNIDPTKNYTNEEIQQIIDNDIKNNDNSNFDLYKILRGRGDLLKQIHDSYVSNDTPNEDEFPKAQTGGLTEEQLLTNRNRVFQDVILDDEMFDEGDFELYLDQAQTGGDLPADYQDFLNYSETAPENRRPDSEWQYGNPRQYDHYGMWDALGKPKTFEEALAKNPHWQPDPYDGMYHGFSTNPDTGVWLKSHIPGESHPGDTGWMEYKDFMLSNDRNWGGKNQNLVFDPELQRMRYIERKQDGGGIINMMQQYGYKPAPETPDVFDQMQKMGILPQPTPTLVEQYNQVMNAFDKPKPKPVRFKVPEDYYTRLMEQENNLNKGLKDGRYYQYTSEEGGNDTIGYGHKLTDDDIKTGRYSKGLTKDEAIGLMRNDVEEHLDRTLEQYEAQYGKGSFDKLHPDLKVLALDFVYNGLPITEYPNFFGAANQYSTTKDANAKKQAYEKMLKNYIRNVKKDGVLIPLGERNNYTRSVLDNLK
jgi:hypothetical protein